MQDQSLLELLRDPGEGTSEGLRECAFCGKMADESTICKHCGEHVKNPTIETWGKRLPLGLEEGGRLNKDFDLQPLNWKLERDIGRVFETKRDAVSLGEHVSAILAHTVTRLGSIDLSKHTITKKQLIFSQMYAGDIFYMYAYLRLISLGKELRLRDLVCESCTRKFEFTADVTSIELVVREKLENLRLAITLRDGFTMAGDRRTKLVLRPITWTMLDSHFRVVNIAETFSKIVSSAVWKIEGMPDGAILTDKEVEQLSKYDMAVFEQNLDRVMGGPRWDIEGTCPHCSAAFFVLLDWSYQNFFSISYRSPRLMRR